MSRFELWGRSRVGEGDSMFRIGGLQETTHVARTRGFPSLRPYLSEIWHRRDFIAHLARMEQKAEHYDTVFGQLWNLLNPLLLAGVYYLLFGVIIEGERGSAEYFSFLTAGLFFFHFVRNSAQSGARSLTTAQQLILNTPFPKAILPLSAVLASLMAFVPTMPVLIVIHVALRQPISWGFLWLPAIALVLTLFNTGLALLVSITTVYFRDTTGFLPYLLRVWMYLSPILYLVEEVPESVATYLRLNPLYPMFASLQQVLAGGGASAGRFIAGIAWSVATLLLGGAVFLYKEREVASRL